MKNTLKSIGCISLPVILCGVIFNVTILSTYKESNILGKTYLTRGPAVEQVTKTVKIKSLKENVFNYLITKR